MTPASIDTRHCVVGLDIGGTKTTAGLVRVDGTVVARATTATPGARGAKAIIDTAAGLVATLVATADSPVLALGVGSAGVIDTTTGFVSSSTDVLAGWTGTNLRGDLATATGLPVTVDNDVNAHALGELWLGAAVGAEHLLFVAVGTGVGAGIIIHGDLLHGAHSVAGEIGHLPSPHAGRRRCTCGALGHLEAVAAGPAMTAAYAAAAGRDVSSLQDVARAAMSNDPHATGVLRDGGQALGQAVGGLLNVIDPDQVVIGGGVASLGEHWWADVRQAARADAIPMLREVPIVPAQLGAAAAVVGAARLAWKANQ